MATRIALALLCASATSFTPPASAPRYETAEDARAGGAFVDPTRCSVRDAMTELRERMMQEELKQRKYDKGRQGQSLVGAVREAAHGEHPSPPPPFYRERTPGSRSRSRTRSWACSGPVRWISLRDDLEDARSCASAYR